MTLTSAIILKIIIITFTKLILARKLVIIKVITIKKVVNTVMIKRKWQS